MEIVLEQSDGQHRMRLVGDCNIYSAAEMRATLLGGLREQRGLELDLSGVTEIDTAGMQVLLAAKRFARAGGQALRLTSHSAPVLALIEIYDLAVCLGDPLIVPVAPAATA